MRAQVGGAWSILPSRLVRDPRIKAGTLAVAATLGLYTDGDGVCWPARATMAEARGISVDSVDRGLAVLVDLGYLVKVPRVTVDGDPDTNAYAWRYDEPLEALIARLQSVDRANTDGVAAGLRPPPGGGGGTGAATGSRSPAALTYPSDRDNASPGKNSNDLSTDIVDKPIHPAPGTPCLICGQVRVERLWVGPKGEEEMRGWCRCLKDLPGFVVAERRAAAGAAPEAGL